MPSPQGESGLTVLAAATVLEQSEILPRPLLITGIDSGEMAHHLRASLDDQLPEDLPITLIWESESRQICLEELAEQDSQEYPCSIYLPATLSPALAALQSLMEVVADLRSPEGGCPWDLSQTAQTLIPYVIEEAYEVADAIQQGEADAIAEELGDLLLQVVLQAQIANEQDQFSLAEVAQGISQKLIRRHPHVFEDLEVESVAEVRQNWEKIKATEKGETSSHSLSHQLRRYARSLPPLMAGQKISEKAAAAGLEWKDITGVWTKFYEELAEFQESLLQSQVDQQQAELGDLLFTLVNLARWSNLDLGEALRETNFRFIQRIQKMEVLTDQPLSAYTLEELEARWQEAKVELGQAQP